MRLPHDWDNVLKDEYAKKYYVDLWEQLNKEYGQDTVYPKKSDVFKAFAATSFLNTKAVILGQDPYHGEGQAHGLSFSVQRETAFPPSLKNIVKELNDDLGCPLPKHGSLEAWTRQGVLLLNTVLTVRKGEPNSHKRLGWEQFTDKVILALNQKETTVVFILWGRHAQQKTALIDTDKHHVLHAPHPSPLSARRGFFGSKPFSKTNELLKRANQTEINWQL